MKQNILLDVKNIRTCDVLVCGGGVTGISAAVVAARGGASVILCDEGGCLGGTSTKGMVGPFMTSFDRTGKRQIIRGFFDEFITRMIGKGGAVSPNECPGGDSHSGYRFPGHVGVTPVEAECIKQTAEEVCLEAGVTLLYHATVFAAESEDALVKRVFVATNTGVEIIEAKVFIDATGNASLSEMAGAEVYRADAVQTATLFFRITGVDKAPLDAYMAEHGEMRERFFMDAIAKGHADGSFPCGTEKLRIYETPHGDWVVNMAQVDSQFDELDVGTRTDKEVSQRRQATAILAFLKQHIPGMENARMVSTATDLGIRESRRMRGRVQFIGANAQKGEIPADVIAVAANSFDNHLKKGVAYQTLEDCDYYGIPLGCLVSANMNNLLGAGKCMDADALAFSAVRVMPPCFAMGEAVGVVAALAVKSGVNVPDVPYAAVREQLLENGVFLGD